MGFPEEELVKPKKVESLRCSICALVLSDPKQCPHCQFCCCSECFRQTLRRKANCPICRKAISPQQLAGACRYLRGALDDTLVRCMKQDCYWTGRLEDRPGHACSSDKIAKLQEELQKLDDQSATISAIFAKLDEQEQELARRGRRIAVLEVQSASDDREVVLKAVTQNGMALQFASQQLKADEEVVLRAVTQSGMALQFATQQLKADKEVVLRAVQEDRRALDFADHKFREDAEFMAEVNRQS